MKNEKPACVSGFYIYEILNELTSSTDPVVD